MDSLDLIEKLKTILSTAEKQAVNQINSSQLQIDERFNSSIILERSLLRMLLNELITDLEALN